MKERPVGVALIGKGYWGSILRKYLDADKRFNILHVAGRDYPLPKIWSDKKTDLVLLATPNKTHFFLIMEALNAGKNVVVEKPMVLNPREAIQIKNLSQKSRLFVITDYTQTFSPGINFLLDSRKKMGKILYYGLQLGKKVKLSGDWSNNIYWHLACHLLSILDLFEPIDKFTFKAKTLKTNEEGLATTGILSFRKGYLKASADIPGREFSVVISGEKGSAVYDAYSQQTVLININGKEIAFTSDERNNLKLMLNFVWDVWRGKKTSNFEAAKRVTDVLSKTKNIKPKT